MEQAAQGTVFEAVLTSSTPYDNPFWDVDLNVTFTAPSGEQYTVEGFWNGGDNWRVRFAPEQVGAWQWAAQCSDAANSGLNTQGSFQCVPYTGKNPLLLHGPLEVAAAGHSLQHADSTPFFLLADTAWNGVLLARQPDWARYLGTRRRQGFNTILFVTTQWRASTQGDSAGNLPYEADGPERIRINPEFFDHADQKIAMINSYGLVAAPVVLWALTQTDPGRTLSLVAAIRLARYELARWGAYRVIWLLGGDAQYEAHDLVEKFRTIGQATFGQRPDQLVTLHPAGQTWPNELFRQEHWFSFASYQSGHGAGADHLRWLVEGPPATQWNIPPVKPVINLEPNYEGHPGYEDGQRFTDYHVRRAAYWSLLVAPPAGIAYGNNPIWNWQAQAGPAENHPNIGEVDVWSAGMDTPGIASMGILRTFFEAMPWVQLFPAPTLVQNQATEPAAYIAVAQTADGRHTVAYLPLGGSVQLSIADGQAQWFDPRTGAWQPAVGTAGHFTAPDEQDWLLVVAG